MGTDSELDRFNIYVGDNDYMDTVHSQVMLKYLHIFITVGATNSKV